MSAALAVVPLVARHAHPVAHRVAALAAQALQHKFVHLHLAVQAHVFLLQLRGRTNLEHQLRRGEHAASGARAAVRLGRGGHPRDRVKRQRGGLFLRLERRLWILLRWLLLLFRLGPGCGALGAAALLSFVAHTILVLALRLAEEETLADASLPRAIDVARTAAAKRTVVLAVLATALSFQARDAFVRHNWEGSSGVRRRVARPLGIRGVHIIGRY